MQHSVKQHLISIAILTSVLNLLFLGSALESNTTQVHHGWASAIGSSQAFTASVAKHIPNTREYRIALRLQERLRKYNGTFSAPINILAKAVAKRQELLKKTIVVTFVPQDATSEIQWEAKVAQNPLWIVSRFSLTEADFHVSSYHVKKTMLHSDVLALPPPKHAVLKSVLWKETDESVSRAEIDGIARGGYLPEFDIIAHSIANALENGDESITIDIEKKNGRIINMTNTDLGKLRLWSTGKSDFAGSTYARDANVRKALNEHVTNSVIAPGELFSFNSTLNGPVTLRNGWKEAKVIFNGGDLEYAPGGGICQASTTVFRSIVNAGFPIQERRAHSLYVSYYKKFGVGIDATIYPGSQDLVFLNDSKHYLVLQAYSDGTEAVVNIYGTPDGREVQLEGPYFANTAPEGFLYNDRRITSNEIVWVQHVSYPSGEARDYSISSRYKELPRSVAREFSLQHAAASSDIEGAILNN